MLVCKVLTSSKVADVAGQATKVVQPYTRLARLLHSVNLISLFLFKTGRHYVSR